MSKELLEAQKELLESTFNKAMAYTNMIIFAGYASFFAIWNFTKPQLSDTQILWSALLISVSLIFFVLFEIYGMFHRSRSMLGLVKVVNNPDKFESFLLEHKNIEQGRAVTLGRIWLIIFPISVITGVCGAGVLIWAFITQLLETYG